MSVRMLSRPSSSQQQQQQQQSSSQQQATQSVPSTSSTNPLSPTSTSSSSPSSPTSFSFPVSTSPPPAPSHSSPDRASSSSAPNPDFSYSKPPSIVLPPPYIGSDSESDASKKGIVVVGVISRLDDESSQLLDRLIDSRIFLVAKCSDSSEQKSHQASSGQPDRPHWSQKDDLRTPPPNPQGGNQELRPMSPNSQGNQFESATSSGHGQEGAKNGGGKPESKEEGKSSKAKVPGARRTTQSSHSNQNPISKVRDIDSDARPEASTEERKATKAENSTEGATTGGERDWIDRKLKQYYDAEKDVLYVQYVWGALPRDYMTGRRGAGDESVAEALERHERDSFRGLLFMFSVCHIVLIVQEGSRFDSSYLHMFRTLQAAKHALAPFVKTQVLPGLLPPPTNRPSQSLRTGSIPSRDSSGRSGASTGRQNSTISVMSGSTPVLYPGQCTPVILFICLEEFTEPIPPTATNPEGAPIEGATESIRTSTISQSVSGSFASPGGGLNLRHSKSSQSTLGSARSGSKTEANHRKKMQSSTETQIRFLLKKCRTLSTVAGEGGSMGTAGAGMGLRGPIGAASSLPGGAGGGALFALDQSRAVILMDRSANQPGAGLEELSDLLFAFLKGGPPDGELDLKGLPEPVAEDLQAIKDFLLRHTEILRGRGGISSGTAGSSAAAGMVAAAAAAAAASASGGASGATKPLHNPPELPTLSGWFSACQILADGLTSAWETRAVAKGENAEPGTAERGDLVKGQEGSHRIIVRRYSQMSLDKNNRTLTSSGAMRSRGTTLDGVITILDSAVDIDLKFSTAWCKRVLPSAQEVYLKDLPASYPTRIHKAHLEKALHTFHAKVRGPAVSHFTEKLKAGCEAVWHANRQLCDAESLTGKPCVHHIHEVVDVTSDTIAKVAKAGSGKEKETEEKDKQARKSNVLGTGKHVSKPHSSGVVFLHACACGRSRRFRRDPFDYNSANIIFFQFPNCEDKLPSLALQASSADNLLGGSAWSLVRLGGARYYQPAIGLMQTGFCPKQNFLSLWDIEVVYGSDTAAEFSETKEDLTPDLIRTTVEMEQLAVTPEVVLPRLQTASADPKPAEFNEENLYSKVAEKGPYMENSRIAAKSPSSVSGKGKSVVSSSSKANYGGDLAFPPLPQKNDKQQAGTPSKPPRQSSGKEKKSTPIPQLLQAERPVASKVPPLYETLKEEEDVVFVQIDEEKEENMSTDLVSNAIVKGSRSEQFRVYVGFEHECPHGHRFLLSVEQLLSLGLSYPQPSTEVPPSGVTSKLTRQDHKAGPMKKQHAALDTTTGSPTTQADKKKQEAKFMSVSKGSGVGHTLLGMDLPIFMNCPHCKDSDCSDKIQERVVYAGCVSQLQRIFLVTPPFPLVLASRAAVEFEGSPTSSTSVQAKGKEENDKKEKADRSIGSEVVLPPDSFLSLRLPFVYHTLAKNGDRKPLVFQRDFPERTAWLAKGTALRVLSKGSEGAGAAG